MESLIANPFYSIFFGQHLVSDQLCVGNDIIPYASRLSQKTNSVWKYNESLRFKKMGHCYGNAVVKTHQILVLTRRYAKHTMRR